MTRLASAPGLASVGLTRSRQPTVASAEDSESVAEAGIDRNSESVAWRPGAVRKQGVRLGSPGHTQNGAESLGQSRDDAEILGRRRGKAEEPGGGWVGWRHPGRSQEPVDVRMEGRLCSWIWETGIDWDGAGQSRHAPLLEEGEPGRSWDVFSCHRCRKRESRHAPLSCSGVG